MLDIFPNRPLSSRELSSSVDKKSASKRKKTNSKSSLEFKNAMLDQVFESEFNGNIESFISELDELQNKMIKKPSISLVDEYRNKIGFFLEKLLAQYQDHSYFKGGLQKRVELKVWHALNQELEVMAQKVISKNIPGFQLLKSLGVIKGLILDLKIGKG